MTDMFSTDATQNPLQTLMGLLDPDKQEWLKAQPQARQQQLSPDFAATKLNAGGGAESAGASAMSGLTNPGLQDDANAFIQDAQQR